MTLMHVEITEAIASLPFPKWAQEEIVGLEVLVHRTAEGGYTVSREGLAVDLQECAKPRRGTWFWLTMVLDKAIRAFELPANACREVQAYPAFPFASKTT